MRATLPRSEGLDTALKRMSINQQPPKAPSVWGRFLQWKQSFGIRSRIFLYFLLFTGLLLVLLWLFQIVFLDEFYRMQKTDMLRSFSNGIVHNIDNENLQTLADRIAEQDNVCVMITDEAMRVIVTAESWNGCLIHHMNRFDLWRYASSLTETDSTIAAEFPLDAFRNQIYDPRKFRGAVPPSDEGGAKSLITVQRAAMGDGRLVYVFLNTLITPVTGTVQTIRNELYFISAILVLLSFILSLVLSRRITQPLVETTEAAAALSSGEYKPVENVGYREIQRLNQQLSQAARDLHRVEEMQNELIANISHDLRTPLTLIEGYAEAMRDLPDENTPENMQVIIDETRRLTTLVNSVLDLHAARRELGAIQKAPFSLTDSIRGIMSRYAKLTEQDGYHIVFEPSEEARVFADEVKVQQVVYNLINNALTYTGEDRMVTVLQTVQADKVRIEVCDTGEGIPPEDLPYIWDRYYRGGKPHRRAKIGSGLGLSIVKNILESHGMAYGVESKEGEGSIFWFELPLEP